MTSIKNLFLRILHQYKRSTIGLLCLGAVVSLLEVTSAITALPVLSSLLDTGLKVQGVLADIFEYFGTSTLSQGQLLATFAVIIGFKGILNFTVVLLQDWISIKLEIDIRQSLMSNVLKATWAFLTSTKTGNILNASTVEAERAVLAIKVLCQYITSTLIITLMLAASFMASPEIVTGGLLAGSVFIFFMRRFVSWSHRIGKDTVLVNADVNSTALENLEGAKPIKGMHLEQFFLTRFNKLTQHLGRLKFNQSICKSALANYQEPAGILVVLAMLYFIINYTSLSTGNVLISLLLLNKTFAKLTQLQNTKRSLVSQMPSVDYCFNLIDSSEFAAEKFGNTPYINLNSGIKIKNVSFYFDEKIILNDINFSIPADTVLGITGSSGGGKSTLLDLLIGLRIPSEGTIQINNICINDLDISAFRDKIGYVPQEAFLINGSILENISLGSAGASFEDIQRAAKLANAHDFIMLQPNGYETAIGERGVKLSGGQRQRIALARALVRNPHLLILDEATSSLDSSAEREIQSALASLKGSRTIILVAHRLSTLKMADDIIVLNQTGIAESGTYEELISKNGLFASLHSHQQ